MCTHSCSVGLSKAERSFRIIMSDNYDKFTVVNYVKTVSCLRVYHTQFQFQSPLTLKIVSYDRENSWKQSDSSRVVVSQLITKTDRIRFP